MNLLWDGREKCLRIDVASHRQARVNDELIMIVRLLYFARNFPFVSRTWLAIIRNVSKQHLGDLSTIDTREVMGCAFWILQFTERKKKNNDRMKCDVLIYFKK